MKCMRCGTEIATDAVFCEDCLAEMEKHPVKPGTPVLLPRREKQAPVKRSKKRTVKPEEQVHRLRRAVILLSTIAVVPPQQGTSILAIVTLLISCLVKISANLST